MKKEPSEERPEAASVDDSGELRPEYDRELIRGGVRGKYAGRHAEGSNVVLLDPDVAAAFPDADAVNAALRALMEIARRQVSGRAPAA